MAKALKYHYEFYDDINEVLKRVEIWVEGFVGDSTELKAGSTPLRRTYNKDVGEKYLGGVVQTSINIEAGSTDSFQAVEISSPNYGDVVIKHKIGDTVLFNAIVVPFEGSDIDLPSTYYNVSLGAECGLNKLASITYTHSGTRKKIIQVIKECLAELPYIDTFPIKVIDSTQVYGTEVLVGTDYWDTYIDDLNFKDDSCLTVIKKLIQVYNEIVFSDGAWYIRNIKEVSTQDSDIHTFAWADLAKTTASYERPVTSIVRRAGGSFGKLFSQQNIKITKGQSKLRNTFPEGDDLTGTGWTYSGVAALYLLFADGRLYNNQGTVYTPSFVAADTTYVESPLVTFYPFQEFFSTKEKERLVIKGLATKGNYIKHLRFQIRASSGGINHYLTTEGTWYTEVSGLPTPIYEKTYTGNQEFNIDIPQPPYVTAGMLSSADRINIGEFGYFNGTDFTLPATNLAYNIYIRVYLPERTWEDPTMTGDEDYDKELEVYIDYLRIEKADISGVVQNGFSRNYGVEETKDRKIDFTVELGVGYPSYPSGLDCLFLASSGESQGLTFGELNSLTSFNIDEFIAESYLNVLANQLKFYQGTVEADLEFTDIIEIDEIKYRIHNLEHDSRRNTSTVKLVELNSLDNVIDITNEITLSDDVIRNIDEQITKTLGSNLPLRYVDINFKETVLPTGERVIGLRDDFRKTSLYTEDAFLKASSNGLTKVVTADTSDDFTWTVPAEEDNRTFASQEWATDYIVDNGWLLDGNALTASKSIGSTTNHDVSVIRHSVTKANFGATTTDFDADVYNFKNGGTTNLHIKSNGDVGKGTGASYGNFYVNETRTTGDRHAFEDWSDLALTDSNLGYCSFDAKPIITNANNYQHYVGFQSRLIYNGSGNVTDYVHGYDTDITHGGSGTISSLAGVRIRDVKGAGVITNNYGLYINDIVRGSTNYAIYSDGGQSYHKGSFGIGATPTRKLQVTSSAVSGTIAASFSDVLVENTEYAGITIRTNDNSLSALRFNSPSGSNFGSALIVHDYTNSKLQIGSNKVGGSLSFMVEEFTHAATLNTTGLGIGTTSPSELLHVNGTSRTTNLKITNGATIGYVWQCNNADGTGAWTTPLTSERYIGEWDANSGSAPSGSPTTGDYWVVNTAGTYSGTTYALGDEIYWNGSTWLKRSNYLTLPTATSSILGGIKIGSGLSIDGSGIVSVATLNQNTTGSAATLTTARTIAASGDATWSVSFNGSANVTSALTLATVATAGTYRSVTVNAKGLVTSGTNPTTLSGYGITDVYVKTEVYTKTESDARYVDLTTNQTSIDGTKGFVKDIIINGINAGQGLVNDLSNTAFGYSTLDAVTTGSNNTGFGYGALDTLTTATENTGIGRHSLRLSVTNGYNTGLGANTLVSVATGSYNVALGSRAGWHYYSTGGPTPTLTNTSNSIFIGYYSRPLANSQTNQIVIGYNAYGNGSNTVTIGNSDIVSNHFFGTVAYGTLLKPNGTAGTSGQFLGTSGTQDVWTTLTTSHISNLSSYTGFDGRYVDLTTTQNSIGGAKTFTALFTVNNRVYQTGLGGSTYFGQLAGQSDDLSSRNNVGVGYMALGNITSGSNNVAIGYEAGAYRNPTPSAGTLTTNTNSIFIGSGAKAAGNNQANQIVIGYGAIGAGANTVTLGYTSTTANFLFGTVKYGTLLKPNNIAGTNGQVLGTNGTQDSWVTLGISNITSLQDSLDAKQDALPSGTAGQFLIRNASAELEFFNLELEPTRLTSNKIAVGDSANYLSSYDNFEFLDSRFISILKVGDSTKAFYAGMYGASNNSFITASGGSLTINGNNGLIFSNFTGGGTLALTVDNDGKVGVTPLGSGGSSPSTLASTYIGYGSSGNVLTGTSKFTYDALKTGIYFNDSANYLYVGKSADLSDMYEVTAVGTRGIQLNTDMDIVIKNNNHLYLGAGAGNKRVHIGRGASYNDANHYLVINGETFSFSMDNISGWGDTNSESTPQVGDKVLFNVVDVGGNKRFVPQKINKKLFSSLTSGDTVLIL